MYKSGKYLLFALLVTLFVICPIGMDRDAVAQDLGDDDDSSIPLSFNELMASNSTAIKDPQGQAEDWIEIHNRSNAPVDAGGLYLTDDIEVPTKWRFPTNNRTMTTIPAGGFLLIWADGDTGDTGLHASFGLDADGDALYLFESDGATLIDRVEFGPQTPNVSYGRYPDDTGEWQFLGIYTPAAPNVQIYEGFVSDVKISRERGFYDEPFEVTITCDTPGALIYYTTDGSVPYQEGGRFPTGRPYTGPLLINKTICLRARAIKPLWQAGKIVTHTYIFLDQVIHQPNSATGFPSTWGGASADYAMDSRIVNPDPQAMVDNLKSIPTLSIVADVDDIFGAADGIYSHATSRGLAYERPASLEFFGPDGREGFAATCGIRMYGDVGRQDAYKKKSLRLFFKGIYGQTKLRYPLFGKNAAQEFDQLILRANFNDCYVFGGSKSQYIRDEYTRRLQGALGQVTSHGTFVNLYINGLYWGLYNPVERPDAAFGASYFGGEKENWDSYKSGLPTGESSTSSWSGLLSAARQNVQTNEGYQRLQGNNPDGTPNPNYVDYLDVENYIDYMIVNFFIGNTDWPHKNWYGAMNRVDSTGFKFFCWDSEWVIDLVVGHGLDSNLYENVVGVGNGAAEPYGRLRGNAEFRLLFADRIHRAFFNGGPLYADPSRPQWNPMYPERNRAAALYAELAASVEKAMVAESARWGDVRGGTPYNIDQWRTERNYILNTYMVQRPGIVMNQFRSAGLYPNVEAPVFQVNGTYQHGGRVATEAELSMTAGGTIWYTVDGSDPRVPAAVPAGATGTTTLVREDAAKRVLVPTGDIGEVWKSGQPFDDSAWTGGTGGVGYERSAGYESFIGIDVVNAMYGQNTTCYIRIPFSLTSTALKDIGSLALKVRYDDGFVAYLNGLEVWRVSAEGTPPAWNADATGSHLDSEAVDFENFDISAHLGALRAGENLLAIHGLNLGSTSSDFLISVELTAAKTPAGGNSQPTGVSPTATRYTSPVPLTGSVQVKSRALSGATWSALNEAVFAVGPVAESLRVSEVMYHPLATGDPNSEYIELTNMGTQSLNLNLVRFTNGIDYTFADFDLPAGVYCLLVKDIGAFEARYGNGLPVVGEYAGSLNNGGERVELVDALGQVIQSFVYSDNWFDITDGLGFSLTVKDPQAAESLDDKKAWRPSAQAGGSPGTDDEGQVPELGSVVINELLANSAGGPDWIELHNTTGQALDIGGWFLSDDANDLTKYQIASGTSIPAGGYLVFNEDDHFGNQSDPGSKKTFGLSRDGETVYLHSGSGAALTGYSEQEKFDASEAGVTLGRWAKSTGSYNFVALSSATPGAANAAPAVGPVVINEIMYHPAEAPDAEYVELLNISDAPVTLYDAARQVPWRFTDDPDDPGVELLFPTDTPLTLAPGGYLLLAKDEDLVRATYGLAANVPILAWGAGNLANGGEKIQLSRPGDEANDGTRTWLRVDRVVYSDGTQHGDFPDGVDPWPVLPDGHGFSLSRIDPAAYGNDPDNWKAAMPSPGQ